MYISISKSNIITTKNNYDKQMQLNNQIIIISMYIIRITGTSWIIVNPVTRLHIRSSCRRLYCLMRNYD